MTTETEKPVVLFQKFNLSPSLLRALEEAKFFTPTPIQDAAIPLGLEGKDILACAQTGTGKTAAFLIPIITHLEKNPNETSLILGPTREIVQQISEAARLLTQYVSSVTTASIIGGGRIDRQLKTLQKKPRLIVGTPGRLNDFIARRKVDLSQCRTLVFDEADRMLDMGFAPQIDQIVKFVPKERQTMMFSATIAPAVEKISRSYLKDAKFISVGQKETAPELLRQKAIITTLDQKENVLKDELGKRTGAVLIFAQTQRRVEKLGYKLREAGFDAETIHGGRTQGQRFRALKSFRDGEVNILVATDVASRGLDIGSISHVINFDLPGNPEDFLHRVGRTARNGKDGDALTLMMQSDFGEYNRIKRYMGECELVGVFAKSSSGQSSGGASNGRSRFRGRSNGGGSSHAGQRSEGGRSSGGFGRSNSGSGRFGRSGGSAFGKSKTSDSPYAGNSYRGEADRAPSSASPRAPYFENRAPRDGNRAPRDASRPARDSGRPSFRGPSSAPRSEAAGPGNNIKRKKYGNGGSRFAKPSGSRKAF